MSDAPTLPGLRVAHFAERTRAFHAPSAASPPPASKRGRLVLQPTPQGPRAEPRASRPRPRPGPAPAADPTQPITPGPTPRAGPAPGPAATCRLQAPSQPALPGLRPRPWPLSNLSRSGPAPPRPRSDLWCPGPVRESVPTPTPRPAVPPTPRSSHGRSGRKAGAAVVLGRSQQVSAEPGPKVALGRRRTCGGRAVCYRVSVAAGFAGF